MTTPAHTPDTLQRVIFDAIPYPVLIVDPDVRIRDCNSATEPLLPTHYRQAALTMRGGEAFHCIHASDSPEGCGHGASCQRCVLRKSVTEALSEKKTVKRYHTLERHTGETIQTIRTVITAAPFAPPSLELCVLFIEDISALITLRTLTPICASCKKIRTENNTWVDAETYLKDYLHVHVEPIVCPDCKNHTP